jgi:hypothetical protein
VTFPVHYRIVTMPTRYPTPFRRFTWQALAVLGRRTVLLGNGVCGRRPTGIRRAEAVIEQNIADEGLSDQISRATEVIDYSGLT